MFCFFLIYFLVKLMVCIYRAYVSATKTLLWFINNRNNIYHHLKIMKYKYWISLISNSCILYSVYWIELVIVSILMLGVFIYCVVYLCQQHYLSYLNCLRVKEFCGSFHSLFHCFDRGIFTLDSKGNTQDEKNRGFRFAALNLAILYSHFGHK